MKKYLLSLTFLLSVFYCFSQSEATYNITFISNWSQATHPHISGNLPSTSHWSKLVGATHNNNISFLAEGRQATTAIKNLAELGSNTVFFNEVNNEIDAGNANQAINGPSLSTAEGQIVISNLKTTQDFPLLTLASMIAPSPDWMIALHDINLLDDSGNWKENITIDVFAYDAGTDSGSDYTSANIPTDPLGNIEDARDISPFSSEKIGTFVIDLESFLAVEEFVVKNKVTIYPNPFKDKIYISSSQKLLNTVEIYNVLGKKVRVIKNLNTDRFEGSLASLTSGIYLMRIKYTDGSETVKKIVKR